MLAFPSLKDPLMSKPTCKVMTSLTMRMVIADHDNPRYLPIWTHTYSLSLYSFKRNSGTSTTKDLDLIRLPTHHNTSGTYTPVCNTDLCPSPLQYEFLHKQLVTVTSQDYKTLPLIRFPWNPSKSTKLQHEICTQLCLESAHSTEIQHDIHTTHPLFFHPPQFKYTMPEREYLLPSELPTNHAPYLPLESSQSTTQRHPRV